MNWEKLTQAEAAIGLHDKANLDLRIEWVSQVRLAVAHKCPRNKLGQPLVSDIDVALASLAERTQALQALSEWVKKSNKKKSNRPSS